MPTVWPYWMNQGTAGTLNCNVQIWQGWVQTAGTTPITYADPWNAWQAQTGGTAASNVWAQWQVVTSVSAGANCGASYVPEPSAEELALRKRQSLILRNRSRAYQLRRNIAARKAEELLLTHLSAEQRDDWTQSRGFHVETADGRRRYRIDYGLAGNVRLVKCEGEPPLSKYGRPLREGARFCMHVYHPDGQVPHEDNVLAQKLLIESNEQHFLELANVT